MNIQVVSDLHIDFPENQDRLKMDPLVPGGEVLILAGDIVPDVVLQEQAWFFQKLSEDYQLVLMVPGNHEFYHGSHRRAYPNLDESLAHNILRLNNNVIVREDVRFLVTTLWTDIPEKYQYEIRSVMNDYRYIYHDTANKKNTLSPGDTVLLHQMSVRFLEKELAKEHHGPTVVVTHHSPLMECTLEAYPYEGIRHAYATDMSELIKKHDIAAWIFGHVHKSFDMEYEGTRLISNPMGYPADPQQKDFNPQLVIEV